MKGILELRRDDLEVVETAAIDRFDVPLNPSADKIIYIIDEREPNSTEKNQFFQLLKYSEKILLVVNSTARFPNRYEDEKIFNDFKYTIRDYYHTFANYWSIKNYWSKISVAYVFLEGARTSLTSHDCGSFQKSNFTDIEDFIDRN